MGSVEGPWLFLAKQIHQGGEAIILHRLLLTLGSQFFDQRGVLAVDGGGTGREIADDGLDRCQGLVICRRLQGGDLLFQSSSII